jgi:hypothetical protein
MNKVNSFLVKIVLVFIALFFVSVTSVSASPYGAGKYGSAVPYGGETSITITTSNVTVTASPGLSGRLNTATNNVTVFSTDVVGFKLYVNALSSATLTATSGTIPASGNVTAAVLATNTWGYNTDASTNFLGMTTTAALLTNLVGPAATSTGGNTTTVTYGVNIDNTKLPGSYTTTLIYTAVPQTT